MHSTMASHLRIEADAIDWVNKMGGAGVWQFPFMLMDVFKLKGCWLSSAFLNPM